MTTIAELKAQMLAEAANDQSVKDLADKIIKKTDKWAKKVGIGTTLTSATPEGLAMGALFDTMYGESGQGGLADNQWSAMKRIFEQLMGTEIPTKKAAVKKEVKPKFEDGSAFKIVGKSHDHNYPMNAVIFVTKADLLTGMDSHGVTPSVGKYFEWDLKVLEIPTKAEVLQAVAELFVNNEIAFATLVELN